MVRRGPDAKHLAFTSGKPDNSHFQRSQNSGEWIHRKNAGPQGKYNMHTVQSQLKNGSRHARVVNNIIDACLLKMKNSLRAF